MIRGEKTGLKPNHQLRKRVRVQDCCERPKVYPDEASPCRRLTPCRRVPQALHSRRTMAHVVAFGGVAAAAPARVSARKSWPARSPMVALPARRVGRRTVIVAARKSAPAPAPQAPVEAPAAVEATGVPPLPQGFVPPPPPPGFNPPAREYTPHQHRSPAHHPI
jgi:hypothetical protein